MKPRSGSAPGAGSGWCWVTRGLCPGPDAKRKLDSPCFLRRLGSSLAIAPPHAPIHTFLIADVRGYSRFTQEYGDEAAARLAVKFHDLVGEGVEIRGGRLIELRGDEALAVFESARQAIQAANDLQRRFDEETDADSDLPLRVGIGIDSGEAIELADGSFRGAALNVAARLCGMAHGGEVLVSESTAHLAGRLPGLRYVDRGRAHLKGIADPVRVIRVGREEEETGRWIFMFFGRPSGIGWRVGLAVVLIAAATAAAVVYLTTGNSGEPSSAAPPRTNGKTTGGTGMQSTMPQDAGSADLSALVPANLWENCRKQAVPDVGAVETAVCQQPAGTTRFSPDRWQLSIYPTGRALNAAYEELRRLHGKAPNEGRCSRVSWGGEGPWEHGPGQPGGRRLCYFEDDDAVIVWTHPSLGEENHRDVLGMAREGGNDHARLAAWWDVVHHVIGMPGEH